MSSLPPRNKNNIKVFNKSLFLTIAVAQQILGTSDHLCSSKSLLSSTQRKIDSCQQKHDDPFNQWKTGAGKKMHPLVKMSQLKGSEL